MVNTFRNLSTLAIALLMLLATAPLGQGVPTLDDDDAGSGTDAGDDQGAALAITPGTHTGRLTAALDHTDWYVFDVPAAHGYSIVSQVEVPIRIEIPEAGGVPLQPDVPIRWYTNEEVSVHILVGGAVDNSGEYSFTLEVTPRPQDDAGSGRDAGFLVNGWLPLADGANTATLSAYDPVDVFTVEIAGTQRITVDMTLDTDTPVEFGMFSLSCCAGDGSYESGARSVSAVFTNETAAVFFDFPFFEWYEGHAHDVSYTLTVTREVLAPGDPVDESLPDLAITRLVEEREAWRPTSGFLVGDAPQEVHEQHHIEIDVTNEGAADADVFYVHIYVVAEDGLEILGDSHFERVEGLAVNETVTVEYEWGAANDFGDHRIYVDVWGFQDESDYGNNHASLGTWARMADGPISI